MSIITKGKVLDIIFQNQENGYTIAVVYTDEHGTLTVTGCMPSVQVQDNVQLSGAWKVHEVYGKQLNIETFSHLPMDSESGVFSYLSSGALEGIGEAMAKRIVDKFGKSAIEILEKTPDRYLEIDGIGKKKLDKLVKSHMEGRELKNIIVSLSPYGITPAYCMKIFKAYKEKSVKVVMENPYALCQDVKGIGFKKADEIAKKLNVGIDSKERIEQGILYTLQESAYEGHTYLDIKDLGLRAVDLLDIEPEKVIRGIYDLAVSSDVVIEEKEDEKRVYLTVYSLAESRAASNLIKLASHENEEKVSYKDALNIIEGLQNTEHIKLSKEQIEGASHAISSNLLVLTGGPGTGKTTTLSFIIKGFEELGKKVALCAPTGRAAKRMSEATGKSASTIHRLLEVGYSDDEEAVIFNKNEDEPIKADAVIVDEISMVDVLLLDSLLKAIKPGTTLVFVGDKDQLPSVGAGSVLRDIIESDTIKTIRLTEVFRQAAKSNIIVSAHRINHGEMPIINKKDNDFFFMERYSQRETADLVVELVSKRLPEYYNLSPKDIQVLSPMRKSEAGVNNLNTLIQEAINPLEAGKREHKGLNRILRTGDKVMHIKNNYEKQWKNEDTGEEGEGIFNGDIGYIDFIEPNDKKLYISFDDGKRVEYDFTELDQIEHAFATTVHKSQGSEFPCVVLPIYAMPPMLMSRKILYTAITRAKKLLVIVGNKKYLSAMVSNIYEEKRNTSLGEKLRMFKDQGIILEDDYGDSIPF